MTPEEKAEFDYRVAERIGMLRPNGGAPTQEQIRLAEKEAHEAIERQRRVIRGQTGPGPALDRRAWPGVSVPKLTE